MNNVKWGKTHITMNFGWEETAHGKHERTTIMVTVATVKTCFERKPPKYTTNYLQKVKVPFMRLTTNHILVQGFKTIGYMVLFSTQILL